MRTHHGCAPTARDLQFWFFLWVHYFAAHAPYYNGGDLAATRFDSGYEGPIAAKKGRLDRVMTEELELNEADLRHLNALYDAAIVGTNHLVAELLGGLEEMGQMERTLVVFLSDHGEELYQHNGYLYHACSVYESTLHVPLGFWGPSKDPGTQWGWASHKSARSSVHAVDETRDRSGRCRAAST